MKTTTDFLSNLNTNIQNHLLFSTAHSAFKLGTFWLLMVASMTVAAISLSLTYSAQWAAYVAARINGKEDWMLKSDINRSPYSLLCYLLNFGRAVLYTKKAPSAKKSDLTASQHNVEPIRSDEVSDTVGSGDAL